MTVKTADKVVYQKTEQQNQRRISVSGHSFKMGKLLFPFSPRAADMRCKSYCQRNMHLGVHERIILTMLLRPAEVGHPSITSHSLLKIASAGETWHPSELSRAGTANHSIAYIQRD